MDSQKERLLDLLKKWRSEAGTNAAVQSGSSVGYGFDAGVRRCADQLEVALREPTRLSTPFNRGDWVVVDNHPGAIIQTDNLKFDTHGVLLVVRVSPNTAAVEVTDEEGVHGIVDRMSLRHTPFVSSRTARDYERRSLEREGH